MNELSDGLREVLERSQRLGFLGDRPVLEAVEHSRGFVRVLGIVAPSETAEPMLIVDLGAGGGLPGLVIAHDRPDVHLVLVDRRSKRTDFLEQVTARLGWGDRITVVNADVADLIARGDVFDVAVARGFGPPLDTLVVASRLVRKNGLIAISEPPTGDRWSSDDLDSCGVTRVETPVESVAVFCSTGFT